MWRQTRVLEEKKSKREREGEREKERERKVVKLWRQMRF